MIHSLRPRKHQSVPHGLWLLPVKGDRLLDIGVQAVVHGARVRGPFEKAVRIRRSRDRDSDLGRQPLDPAGRVRGHLFRYADTHALDSKLMAFGDNPHDCCHAGRESGCNEIRGGEGAPVALVVDRRSGRERNTRIGVNRPAFQVACVLNVHRNHDVRLNRFPGKEATPGSLVVPDQQACAAPTVRIPQWKIPA